MIKNAVFIALIVLPFLACNQERKCAYKPTAIFQAGLPHVVQYNFEVEGEQSLESLLLDTNVLLEIYQQVCDKTLQEYKFTVQGDYSQMADSMWLKEASRQLVFLSTLSSKHLALKDWADIIELRRTDMKLGEKREVQQGIFVKVDRILSPEQSALLVTFSQE
jgi:hypothetical protein